MVGIWLISVVVALLLATEPPAAEAQAVAKVPRLCFLTFDPGTVRSNRFTPFFQGLRDLGYVDGQNLTIDYLSADGRAERLPSLAAECARLGADIVVVTTTPAAQAAKIATSTIPIVMHPLGDPVGTGLVKSLARPGGNVTGLSSNAPGLAAKRLELLKEVLPRVSRVLVLSYLVDPIAPAQVEAMKKVAGSLRLTLQIRNIRTVDDLPAAFAAGAQDRTEALVTTAESIFFVHRSRVIELAGQYKLPAVYPQTQFVESGGLMSYAADYADHTARAAAYVDKIIKGAKPGDLPVEEPRKFQLAINLRTAKTLGLTIPVTVRLRADHVVE